MLDDRVAKGPIGLFEDVFSVGGLWSSRLRYCVVMGDIVVAIVSTIEDNVECHGFTGHGET